MTAISGKGTLFNRWDGSQWEQIAQINSISGPTMNRETIDVTTLDSEGGYRKFIGSLRDGGDVSLPMNFTRDTYTIMKTDFEDDDLQKYQIVLPDSFNTTLEFEGFVTDLPLDIPLDDKVSADITIKISGQTELTSVLIIVDTETLAAIPAANGTQLSAIGLPTEVDCDFDNDTNDDVDVVWDTGTPMYNGAAAGAYVFVGTLVPSGQVLNPLGITTTVTVNVAE